MGGISRAPAGLGIGQYWRPVTAYTVTTTGTVVYQNTSPFPLLVAATVQLAPAKTLQLYVGGATVEEMHPVENFSSSTADEVATHTIQAVIPPGHFWTFVGSVGLTLGLCHELKTGA